MKIKDWYKIYFLIFPLRLIRYHSYRIGIFVKKVVESCDEKDKKILDVGAGDCPYKKCFKHILYFSQDVRQNKSRSIDFVGDINTGLNEINDNFFDYILCTQVLEHIKEPKKAFKEFYRVLKPGGKVFLTTHLCFEEHMIPYDYFRFTKYGLKYLGESSGFAMEHIAPHGGVFHLLALIVDTIPIKIFFKRQSFCYHLYLILFTIPILIFNSLCYLLDFLDKEKIMTLNYECVYYKKK